MTFNELNQVLAIFPTAQADESIKCPRCRWEGAFRDLWVISPDYTTFICPQCIEPVANVPHCWFCGELLITIKEEVSIGPCYGCVLCSL